MKKNVFTKEVDKIDLRSNDDKKMQSINSIETYANGMNKNPVCKEEESKCNNIIKQNKVDYMTKEDVKKHKPHMSEIPNHPFRIFIVGGSGSGITNALLSLINYEPDPYEDPQIHMKQNINC